MSGPDQQTPPQQPGSNQYQGPPPWAMTPPQPSKGFAVSGLVLGIIGLVVSVIPPGFVVGIICGILGIIFGGVGLSKAKRGMAGGKGMAVAGLACGVIAIVISIVWFTVPSLTSALDRSRQATTVSNVVQLGQGVDRYIQDHSRIGVPRVNNVEELFAILEEEEICLNRDLIKDGWGHNMDYRYDSSGSSRHFTIQSFGADGYPGPEVSPDAYGEFIVRHFNEDIIYSSGRLVQYPMGSQN